MALILNIETSTSVCSAAIAKDGKILAERESFDDRSHGTLLTVFIEELLNECKLTANELDAISVSEGPGSYTGLRIGVSVAKGICYATQKPLIAINTLQAMALMARDKVKTTELIYCPMIDARRMEVYSAMFDSNMKEIRKTMAEVIDENSFASDLLNTKIAFFGDGALKCKGLVNSENAIFLNDIYPSAKFMAFLAETAYKNNTFKDVAYFEPFYLKDFVATIPKKRVF
ncbi:MAG: tRNA (adenosine(37)-N6)-threonylcarbamoyltransferase complex dimerization subunit type 1 TsaB [Salinivirgaceae bacterium]|nr:tRNA (adenosine(37)-N6)-threonylcarbamoyltransferase complex dimerization subunit type 1 TsaB [Salinivirgaceae bacterium]